MRWVCACQTSLYLYKCVNCVINVTCTFILGLAIFSDVRLVLIYGISIILGLSKGAKAVFQSLIVPKYVSLEKIPSANGLLMVLSGLLSLLIGPIIGTNISTIK